MKKIDKKLFQWVSILAMLSGAINSFTIINFSFTVGHITGTLTKILINFNIYNFNYLITLLSLLLFFFLGAVLSGIIIENSREFTLKKRYGDTLILIGLVIKFITFYSLSNFTITILLTFLLGIQNGLFIRYKGMVMRTTHMSGLITDLGVAIGYCIRGNFEIAWKIKYYFWIIFSFSIGGLISAIALKNQWNVLNFIALTYIFNGIYYFWIRYNYYH